ncbi:MAG: diacylglycerol/lipid kinase family protein [Labedaea sp.]
MPFDRAVIIANPAARGCTDDAVTQAEALCRQRVGEVSVAWTAEPEHATKLAAESISDTPTAVLAVGGDGTAREVVHGLVSRDRRQDATPPGDLAAVAMFIVPAGTSNSCYRSFWGEQAWPAALDAALTRPERYTRLLDLALLAENGKLVLAGAATGFPPQAVHNAAALTHITGRAKYETALVRLAATYQPYPGRVLVDGVVIHSGPTMLANVGGSRYRGGQFEVLPHSVVDDGLLDVCVIGGEHSPAEMLALTRTGEHLIRSGVVYARGRRITLERTDGRPVWFEHDGEVLPETGGSYTLEVVPAAVPMLVGAAADRGLRSR